MKHFFRFLVVQAFVLLIMIGVLFVTAISVKEREIDIIDVNDKLQTARENWDDLSVFDKKDYEILILDKEDHRLYVSSEKVFEGIKSPLGAVEKGMIEIPIHEEDKFLGTMVIPAPAGDEYSHVMQRLIKITILIAVITILSYLAFFFYIHQNIIKPFKRMKQYAALIAQGKLDEPLIMDRTNIFGLFTESFDTMREELKASRERELALKLKEKELVASLSHDLQSPVTGIKLICELLEVKVEDQYLRGKILTIDHKTEEIKVLLNNLLNSALDDLSEMHAHCTEMTSDELDRLVEEHDPKKKIESLKAPECILHVDPNRLSQVIGNIIGNSYKYADTKIDVNYQFYENFLKMEIRDYGEGVDEEEIPLLTNKFFRGKNTAKKEGSGLGLYISSELMKKMNGQLICKGVQGGFCVVLLIPLA